MGINFIQLVSWLRFLSAMQVVPIDDAGTVVAPVIRLLDTTLLVGYNATVAAMNERIISPSWDDTVRGLELDGVRYTETMTMLSMIRTQPACVNIDGRRMGTLIAQLRFLAMAVHRVGIAWITGHMSLGLTVPRVIHDFIAFDASPDMLRFLLRALPATATAEYIIDYPDNNALARQREQERTRAYMERALFGRCASNDAIQLVARFLAPDAVTSQRPLRLVRTQAQCARDAPFLSPTLTVDEALDDALAIFDSDPVGAKRKLDGLRERFRSSNSPPDKKRRL